LKPASEGQKQTPTPHFGAPDLQILYAAVSCLSKKSKKHRFKTLSFVLKMALSATMASFSLEGQTAMITGGTRGIGQAVAVSLAECGADIILIQVYILSYCCKDHQKGLRSNF
jgi:hypothetical protein